ncbi:AAA family ATPase [Salinicola rhizosphaerae]|uniref:Nuclease SbcCD subunit C n=1 Tax=Salinicola rhizosphaerae TaxID=1443141 RepID=A0ABQ3E3S9_9GAMM|nr:AAA family ATPase [Salinicola rhizosphaerae]GHB23901.1 nuclease SbcCD subunit C [Salinicola rhizosphaerae]
MKILAIRLENLASLAGHHELDFTAPPLADQGLFAITGPTGAGKSTLLDALCLSLYGSTPRLRQAPSRDSQVADVKQDTLATADARTLLRRGAASGFAEVDFLGRDGTRYRARWAVRRARDKVDGSLQKAEQSLTDLDSGRVLTAQKREFDRLLPERLGLSFDQFTRAVLLAQSEFAAFLKADDNARSELLERLTDTQHYSAISIAAHARVREARLQLETLDARLADALPVDDEARLQLEQDAAAEESALNQLLSRIAKHQRESTELEREADMAKTWQAAQDALRRAESDCHAREDDRRTLDQLQALAPWRERAQRRQSLQRTLAHRDEELSRTQEALSRGEQEAEALAADCAAATAARDDAETAYHADQPRLEDARRLSSTLERQRQQLAQQQEVRRQLDEEIAADRQRFEALTSERQRIDRELDEQRLALARLLAECTDQTMAAHATPETLRDRLNARREAAQTSLSELQTLAQAWQAVAQIEEDTASLRQRLLQERGRLAQLEHDGRQAKATLTAQEIAAQHVSEQIELARAARSDSVERLRRLLHDDAPCPVCGSVDHPYLDDPEATPPMPPEEALLAAIETQEQEQLASQASQLEAARERHHQLGAEWRACRDGLNTLEPQLAALTPRRQAANDALEALPQAQALREAEAPETWLRDRREQWQADYAQSSEQLSRLDAIEKAQRPREAERQRSALALGKLEERLTLSRQRLAALDETLPALTHASEESGQALQAALGEHASTAAWQAVLEGRRREAQQRLESHQARWQTASQAQAQRQQQFADQQQRQQEERREFDELDHQWQAWRSAQSALSDARIEALLAWQDAAIEQLGETLARLDRQRENALITRDERRRTLVAQRRALVAGTEDKDSLDKASLDKDSLDDDTLLADATGQQLAQRLESLQRQTQELEQQRESQQEQRDSAQHRLREDDRRRKAQREGASEREAAANELHRWKRIGDLIGSADGKAFRRIAQAYNLDHLLTHANQHLHALTPRYRLIRGGSDLGILVIDGDMADERRSVHSLSGGETFLVSLALALGLASMASHQLAIESLFIDEGFGSLDSQSLALAMDALDGLQAQGRRVGIISHVQEMHERIPLQIRVEPAGNGASQLSLRRA